MLYSNKTLVTCNLTLCHTFAKILTRKQCFPQRIIPRIESVPHTTIRTKLAERVLNSYCPNQKSEYESRPNLPPNLFKLPGTRTKLKTRIHKITQYSWKITPKLIQYAPQSAPQYETHTTPPTPHRKRKDTCKV